MAEKITPSPWTILRVPSNMARKVACALGPKTQENPHGAGLTVYVPIEKFRPANHWRPKTRPLMPGYVFALLTTDEELDVARGNHAVREVMCQDGDPVKVPAILIGSMILLEACHAFDRTWKPPPFRSRKRGGRKASFRESRWEHGKRVRITDGPFAGFLGTVMATPRNERIAVLTAIFGRQTTIEVGDAQIEAEQDDAPRSI
jgi:transcription antitermination factor NusG